MKRLLIILTTILLFSACATRANITEDMSPAELIQRGQEAMDRNRYNLAIRYYEALYDQNRTNIDLIITAEYSIGFIHYKQRKYDLARMELNSVLAYYDSPDEELLPQHFKRLAQIVLENLEEKASRRRSR